MKYVCETCGDTIHYPICLPFSQGTGYLCHPCFRYLSTAVTVKLQQQERREALVV